MPTINVTPKTMTNGDSVLYYKDTVGTTGSTFSFPTSQERVVVKNLGVSSITYTIGSQTGSLGPSETIDVTETISQFTLTASAKTQAFEVWADELGSNQSGTDLSSIMSQLAHIATNPTFKTTDDTKTAGLGIELIDGTGWIVPSGWTGDYTNGFRNTVGNLNPLTRTMTSTGTKIYQVAFRVESPTPAGIPNASTDFTVSIGNSAPFITYQGGGNYNYTFGIQSVSDGNLVFTPGSTFDGTIKNISVKEITGTINPSLEILDSTGNKVLEVRTSRSDLYNKFIGKESGKSNTTGYENTSVGDLSLVKNTTGYWNTVVGKEALENNTVGSRNVAIGYLTLNANISGDRNIAIGSFTLQRNTTGRQNIALGADCLWVNTTGAQNIGMGMGTMGSNDSGNANVAIGYTVMNANVSGSYNVAIGYNALYNNVNSDGNVAVGREALKNTTAAVNTGVGYGALGANTSGISNTAVGYNSLSKTQAGSENAVFGHYAAASGTVGDISKNALFGAWAGNHLTAGGNQNTFIGYGAGMSATTGANNICIGYNADLVSPTDVNKLNIGNTIYGSVTSKQIGINVTSPTASLHLPAGGTAAFKAPLKFTSGSLLTSTESGAMEFDGTNLYFTINGVRKTIQMV